MQRVSQYLQRNKNKVNEIFQSFSKDKELPATKLFTLMQQITAINQLSFLKDGKQFFKIEQNQTHIQKNIEKYYKTTPDGKVAKFYLYRITFSYAQFLQFLDYWIKNDKSLVIKDPFNPQNLMQAVASNNPQSIPNIPQTQQPIKQSLQQNGKQPQQKGKQPLKKSNSKQISQKQGKEVAKKQIKQNISSPKIEESSPQNSNEKIQQAKKLKGTDVLPNQLRQSTIIDNQFLVEQQKKAILVASYEAQLRKMEQMLLRISQESEQYKQINAKIQLMKSKIVQLNSKKQSSPTKSISPSKYNKDSPPKMKTEVPKARRQVNFKLLFQFYAKQNHLTGVKASFQRIEHQSQTINYQKLVHFLKEYQIFPEKPKDQKKLHNLYVRTCSNTRDLHYQQFMQFLDKLPQVLYTDAAIAQHKKDQMMSKIKSKSQKHKVLHNPFHSLQKQDFRIDRNELKYQFKLKPVKGKLQSQVNLELQNRKKMKQQQKQQIEKQKQQKQIKKLKKLSAIDPYHPLVIKNAEMLRQKSFSAIDSPIASLQNMQKFRDQSFDMKAMFGISDFKEDPMKPLYRYNMEKQVQMIEKQQSLKMSNLMSGIIERSEAKLAKLGLSPKKRQFSSRLN